MGESGARADSEVPEVLEVLVLGPLRRISSDFLEDVCNVLKAVPIAIARVSVDCSEYRAIPVLIEAIRRHGVDPSRFVYDAPASRSSQKGMALSEAAPRLRGDWYPCGGHTAWRD